MFRLASLLLAAALVPLLLFHAGRVQALEDRQTEARAWVEEGILAGRFLQKLHFEAEPSVEEMATGWRLLLPPALLHPGEGEEPVLRTGEAELQVEPAAQARFALQWRLPEEFRLLPDEDTDEELGHLRIAEQRGRGLYDVELDAFLDIDALLRDVALSLAAIEATLGEAGLLGESRPRDDGRVDSDSSLTLRDFALAVGPMSLELGRAQIDAAIMGFDSEAYAVLLDALRADKEASWSFQAPGLEAGAATLTLADLDFAAGATRLRIGSGEAALAMDGLENSRSTLVLQAAIQDLQAAPLSPLTEGLLPRNVELDVELAGLPNAELDRLFEQFNSVRERAGSRYATGLTLPDLWRLLQRAGAEIALPTLVWDAALVQVRGDAMLNPSSEAALGLFGQARLEIAGLPALIQQLRARPEAERLVQILTLIQGLGAPLDSSDPAAARRYDLLVTGDGRLDVNGTDIMPLVPGLLRQRGGR